LPQVDLGRPPMTEPTSRPNIRRMSAFSALVSHAPNSPVRVAEVMHWGLVSCPADASLETVAKLMSRDRVHCVVVIEDPCNASSLWGVVSDLDLVAAAIVRPLAEQEAGGTAMRPAVTISPAEQLERAARLMTRYGVAHLVVVDPVDQVAIGVLSTLDLARALSAS
jgi:CBS domain-containing protein